MLVRMLGGKLESAREHARNLLSSAPQTAPGFLAL